MKNQFDNDHPLHPTNYFPTFTDSEFVEWLLIGDFEDVHYVYELCVENKLEHFADLCGDVLRRWHDTELKLTREIVRGSNVFLN